MDVSPPIVVFGLPAYNGEEHLAEALESLIAQTRRDLAVIVVDDDSTDGTESITRRYAALDGRVSYERNERTLGLVRNWRRAVELAVERFPDARYFAWASDHDVWHPRWLEALAAELEAHPEAVLAYPQSVKMDDSGAEFPVNETVFDTAGVADPLERLRQTIRHATFGGTIYGLFRADAVRRAGPFPLVVLPDNLYVARMALAGEFRQVPRRLWYRRYRFGVVMSVDRQRRAFFPEGVPLWAHAPWWLMHAVVLARSRQRAAGPVRVCWVYLAECARRARARKQARRAFRRLRRAKLRARGAALPDPVALLRRLRTDGEKRRESPGRSAPAPRAGPASAPPPAPDPRDEGAFAAYERVRDEVLRMLAARPGGADDLGDLLDASPSTVAALRRQAHRVGGVSPEGYEPGAEEARRRHTRKLVALERVGSVVYEPRLLGGFGFETDGGLVNADTLRFSEALIALGRAEVLPEIAPEGTVLEIGAGWGGFAYHLKSLLPGISYAIVDRPERFLVSAVYLLTAFPDARAVFWSAGADPARLGGADFVFVDEEDAASVPLEGIDLAVGSGSLEALPAHRLAADLDRLGALGVPYLYSLNRDRSVGNPDLRSLRELLERHYWVHEPWILRWAHDQWIGEGEPAAKPKPNAPERVVYDPDRYHHLIGRRRLVPQNPKRGFVP